MSGLVIKDIPPDVHRMLKEEAAQNKLSIEKQALILLEWALKIITHQRAPKPVKGKFPLTQDFIDKAIHEGRNVKDWFMLNFPRT